MNFEFFQDIADLTILRDEPLKNHSSYRIGGPADLIVIPQTMEALKAILLKLKEQKLPYIILSQGTNVLFPDRGVSTTIIKIDPSAEFANFIKMQSAQGKSYINSGAGTPKADLVKFSLENSIDGFSFLAGIPGTLGGGIKMNAGTADGKFSAAVKSFTVITSSGDTKTYKNPSHLFSYRKLDIPGDEIIISMLLYTREGDSGIIRDKISEIIYLRKKKHPLSYPTCGCIFKNPPHAPAGLLIEKNKLKGYTVGGARVSELHGNFIVNSGEATSKDVTDVISHVKEVILKNEKIELHEEVVIIQES